MASAGWWRCVCSRLARRYTVSPPPPVPPPLRANPPAPHVALARPRAGAHTKPSGDRPPASLQGPGRLPHRQTPGRAHPNRWGPPSPAACLRHPAARSGRAPSAPPALLGPYPARNPTLLSFHLTPTGPGRGLRAPQRPRAQVPALTTLRNLCTALAPASLERSPTLPTSHRPVLSAFQHGQSGHDGHSLYPCTQD